MVWNYDASGASLETGGVYKRERRSRVSYVAALWQHFQFFKFGFFKMQGIGAKKTKKLRKSNEFP